MEKIDSEIGLKRQIQLHEGIKNDRQKQKRRAETTGASLGLDTLGSFFFFFFFFRHFFTKETEEIVEEMKERDREERETGMKEKAKQNKKKIQKKQKHCPPTLIAGLAQLQANIN